MAKKGRTPASGFGTKIDYALRQGTEQEREHKPVLESGFSRVSSLDTAPEEMMAVAGTCRKAKLPCYSFSISLSEGEVFGPGQARDIVDHHLTALNLQDNQYIWAVQDDGKSGMHHVHVVVNLVNPDTRKVIQPYQDFDKLHAADRDAEREFGFRQVTVEKIGLSAEARDFEYYKHRPSLERHLKEVVGPALRETLENPNATWADFHHTCAERNVRYEQVIKNGRVGAVFSDEVSQHAKASKLGPDLSYTKLIDRLGTFEQSREPKREHTAEEVIERAERLAQDASVKPSYIVGQLTKHEATFSEEQAKKLIDKAVEDPHIRTALWADVHNMSMKVSNGKDTRFTTIDIWNAEKKLEASLAKRDKRGYGIEAAAPSWIEGEQVQAFEYACGPGQVKHIDGIAGAGKTTYMKAVVDAHEAQGYRVQGYSTDHVAVKEMVKAGLPARTVASELYRWEMADERKGWGHDKYQGKTLIVIDEITKLGAQDAATLYAEAIRCGAKVIDMGGRAQFESVGPSPAIRIIERAEPGFEMTKTRRQQETWQREAVESINAGNVKAAYDAYRDHGCVYEADTQVGARAAVAARFAQIEASGMHCSIGTLTNAERKEMNVVARDAYRDLGRLDGPDTLLNTMDGQLPYAKGDRVVMRTTIKELGLSNREEMTVAAIDGATVTMRKSDGKNVTLDMREDGHNQFQHAYCQTDFGTQSRTHDAHLQLATKHINSRAAMVAMSRHRYISEVFYSREHFRRGFDEVVTKAERKTDKELATDYSQVIRKPNLIDRLHMTEIQERIRMTPDERLAAKQEQDRYNAELEAERKRDQELARAQDEERKQERSRSHGRSR